MCVQVENILKRNFNFTCQRHSGLNFLLVLFLPLKAFPFFFQAQNLNCLMAGGEFGVDTVDINEIYFQGPTFYPSSQGEVVWYSGVL